MLESMHEIYICYSKWHQKIASEITSRLEADGLKCWIMSRDIDYAADWDEQIENAVRSSVLVVYLKPENPSVRILHELEIISSCHVQLMSFDPDIVSLDEVVHAVIAGMDKARENREKTSRIYPYTGNEPFIFASYSHRDMPAVFEIIRGFQKRGYRIWFDEGIDPGTEWDEYIAAHIDASGYMIAFLSDNYFQSSNCRDELSFARDLGKPLLLIYLRENALPPGMQLRLNRIQAIHWYSYKEPDEFYEKAGSAAGIDQYR